MAVIPFPADRAIGPPRGVLEAELVRLRRIAARANNIDMLKDLLRDKRALSSGRLAIVLREHLMAE